MILVKFNRIYNELAVKATPQKHVLVELISKYGKDNSME